MSRIETVRKAPRGMAWKAGISALAMATSLVGLAPAAGAAEEARPLSEAVSTTEVSLAVAAGSTTPTVQVTGHGWGHGRGLSQYGAFGYAEQGWTSAQILDHFYGGTTGGPVPEGSTNPDPNNLRVELKANRGFATRVDVEHGTIRVMDGDTVIVETAADSGQAVSVQTRGSGLRVRTAPSCAGPWTVITDSPAPALSIVKTSTEDTASGLLRVCHPNDSSTWYDGSISSHNIGGTTRTVNVVSVEQYLRGVVPKESPAYWPAAALEAQSVAARSYVLAGDTRQQPYADTCDTTLCQVYKGRFLQVSGFEASTAASTDAAIAATAGIVRLRDGAIARTEFSSSSGGYTAGGDFPAVVDEGDAIASNPNHNWSKTVDLGAFEDAQNLPNDGKPELGQLLSVEVTGNGLGVDGGRALSVKFVFSNGSVSKTGNEVRRLMGLKSDWFSIGAVQRTFGDGSAVAYVDHIFQLFLGRAASEQDLLNWAAIIDRGGRSELTDALVLSDEWAGVIVEDFYQSALGRGSDSSGRTHWLGQIESGVRIETIGSHFYGSEEYFNRSGGTNESFVTALYQDLLERSPDADGLSFWSGKLDRGEASPGGVAAGFYASIESRRSRVSALYQRILLRGPDSEGHEYWAGRLLSTDDIRLASDLAASTESYQISQD